MKSIAVSHTQKKKYVSVWVLFYSETTIADTDAWLKANEYTTYRKCLVSRIHGVLN